MRKIRRSAVLKLTDERGNRLLGIAVDHDGVIICKERILDTGEARALSALQHEYCPHLRQCCAVRRMKS